MELSANAGSEMEQISSDEEAKKFPVRRSFPRQREAER